MVIIYSILFNIMSEIDDGLQVIYMLRCRWLLYIVFCSTSRKKLILDFKLYICYAADGSNIWYFVQHHVRSWCWTSRDIYIYMLRCRRKSVQLSFPTWWLSSHKNHWNHTVTLIFPYPSMTFDTPTKYRYLWKTALVVAKPWNIIE